MKKLIVNTAQEAQKLSHLLRGACMEDVNHELYGGIWSQMIFGEAFEEGAEKNISCEELTAFGNTWEISGGAISCLSDANGPKVVFENTSFGDGIVSAEITLSENGIVGFIARADNAKNGADAFRGYEIAVGSHLVRLARHDNNYVNLADAECGVEVGDTISLTARLNGGEISVCVNGVEYIRFADENPIPAGKLGLRCWGGGAVFEKITLNGEKVRLPEPHMAEQVSGMWLPYRKDGSKGTFRLDCGDGYSGRQSQVISADGETGVANRGLNRSGMYFAAGRDYRGYIFAKTDSSASVELTVSLRNKFCTKIYAKTTFTVGGGWKKYPFTLVSDAEESDGCFVVSIEQGEVKLGYAFLEAGEWGLYKGLHVRRDVGEGLEHMGINLLRFGGCMANAKDYKWKNMLGEPENRRPYAGWWYPHSSYGFGILEFVELCEALGVDSVPDFNGYETGEDMRDFARYALGTDENDEWVRRRMQSNHPQPYKLRYIQYGNEEKVTEDFADRFIAACRGVWSVDPDIIMVVGDFSYVNHTFDDPYNIPHECTDSHITTLAPHKRILEFAISEGQRGKVWFDIHWWSERGSNPLPCPETAWSFYSHLNRLVPDSGAKLCVYELNANSHDWERAMANAYSIFSAMNHSDILPCMSSANCLQVDKQNDNDWNQGLLFMNNRSVWYQGAGLLDIMLERVWLGGRYSFNEDIIDEKFNAAVMAEGDKISVCLLNRADEAEEIEITLPCLEGKKYAYARTVMSYPKNALNTAENPTYLSVPDAVMCLSEGKITLTMPANSIITLAI
ncbi:MAG: hypothetical protein ACI4XJ_08095 [Eubacteriales bacterium]